MDRRRPIAPGTLLLLTARSGRNAYIIGQEIGRGGSCIVYDASYEDNLGNRKLVRVKECYPHALNITRADDGALRASPDDRAAFEAAQARMRAAYQRHHELFQAPELTNSVTNTSDIYSEHGTVYIVSIWLSGETLAEHTCATLREGALLTLAAAKALRRIHQSGYLYLDLKPENIMTVRGSTDLVQLFDFDSMISREALREAVRTGDTGAIGGSYTPGYAPLEQMTGKLGKIGPHSDVYSLGAVLFDLLFGRTPTAFDCESGAAYNYDEAKFDLSGLQDRLRAELTVFFHSTIASYTGDRYPDMDGAITALETISRLADARAPFVISSPLCAPAFFTGREDELSALGAMLNAPDQRVFSLSGPAGIGKSALARAYLSARRSDYDGVMWLYDQGQGADILLDDRSVRINTFARRPEETPEEYLWRKMRALETMAADRRIMLVIDDVSPDHWDALRPVLSLGLRTLLISRERLPEGLCPAMTLGGMDEGSLRRLFSRYAHADIACEADEADFHLIEQAVGGHTLMMELIARQIAQGFIDLHEAARLVEGAGLKALSRDRVDYLRDMKAVRATLWEILDALLALDRVAEEEKTELMLLGLFGSEGVRGGLFRALTGDRPLEALERFMAAGWLASEGGHVRMHPLLIEYLASWPWTAEGRAALDGMLSRLTALILPEGAPEDADKQFPVDFGPLGEYLSAAHRLLKGVGEPTPASQRLLFRLLMDAPVDHDEAALQGMTRLLDNPVYLDDRSVMRLWETAVFLLGRLGRYDEAYAALDKMRAFLAGHRDPYYASIWHRAMAVIRHNEGAPGALRACLAHEDRAIDQARRADHPDAKKQLISSLLDKATTLIDAGQPERAEGAIAEVGALAERYADSNGYEMYQYNCISAMYCAVTGRGDEAKARLSEATRVADRGRDSDMAYIDHLIEQAAPIYDAMGLSDDAEAAVREAIDLCDRHDDMKRYRAARFDALMFIGKLYAMSGKYILSEAAYDRAETLRADAPYPIKTGKSLCPRHVRQRAAREREKRS